MHSVQEAAAAAARGDLASATQLALSATTDQPDSYDAWFLLGELQRRQGQFVSAAGSYGQAAALRPQHAAAYLNCGLAWQAAHEVTKAVAALTAAVQADPHLCAARMALGMILHEQGGADTALSHYRAALKIDPSNAQLWYLTANALRDCMAGEQALQAYDRAVQLLPGYTEALANRADLLLSLGMVPVAVLQWRTLADVAVDNQTVQSNFLLTLNYDDQLSPQEVFEAHQRWGARREQQVPLCAGVRRAANPDDGPRIGFLSADLHEHSVAWFLKPLLDHRDHSRWKAICYDTAGLEDECTARLRTACDGWRSVAGLDDRALCAAIMHDGIDILVDLGGHTGSNRLGVCAGKPAPLQLSWLGYPNTSGLSRIDGRLADRLTDPPGSGCRYTEHLWYLDGCFICYGPDLAAPAPAPAPQSAAGHVTFGSFNNLGKISEQTVQTWSALLHAVGGSRLLLKSRFFDDPLACRTMIGHFRRCGIAPERLTLKGRIGGRQGHLQMYNAIDIALDTFPYNGTTTTCEALWMGVPVIGMTGDRHAARVGHSLLHHAGLGHLVATDQADFVRIGIELARQSDAFGALRAGLRDQLAASALCDGVRFAADWERAVLTEWRTMRECTGKV